MPGEVYRATTQFRPIGVGDYYSDFGSTHGMKWRCEAELHPTQEISAEVLFNLKDGSLLEPQNQLKGFHGSFSVVYFKFGYEYREKFEVQLYRDFVTEQRTFHTEPARSFHTCRLRFEFELFPIYNTKDIRRIDANFLRDEKKNAVLVVDGKKLHVNKALLAYHSDFFATLFQSDFLERTMEEIPIRDVSYEDFSRMLCLIHPNPVAPHPNNAEGILELADRFMIPAARHHVENFLIMSLNFSPEEKIAIGDKYSLNELIEKSVMELECKARVEELAKSEEYKEFSNETKALLLDRLMCFPPANW